MIHRLLNDEQGLPRSVLFPVTASIASFRPEGVGHLHTAIIPIHLLTFLL